MIYLTDCAIGRIAISHSCILSVSPLEICLSLYIYVQKQHSFSLLHNTYFFFYIWKLKMNATERTDDNFSFFMELKVNSSVFFLSGNSSCRVNWNSAIRITLDLTVQPKSGNRTGFCPTLPNCKSRRKTWSTLPQQLWRFLASTVQPKSGNRTGLCSKLPDFLVPKQVALPCQTWKAQLTELVFLQNLRIFQFQSKVNLT